jgi:hypothetical protein
MATTTIVHAVGRGPGSLFTGGVATVGVVLLLWGAFASVGWTLPARIASQSGRPFERVRRTVAITGFVGSCAVVWLVIPVKLDEVLAVGLPIGPVAFLLAALRAPEEKPYRPGVVAAIALGLALVIPTTLLAIASAVAPARDDAWSADLSRFGIVPSDAGLEGIDATADWETWSDSRETLDFLVDRIIPGTPPPDRLRVEVWPAAVVGGELRVGPVPLVAAEKPFADDVSLHWMTPALRAPVDTVRTLVAVMPDGTRVLLDQDLMLRPTPPWSGTLAAWWFAP